MPLTPYHLGPAIAFGLLLNKHINLTTFIIANVIVDIEPFIVLVFNLPYPLHGFFHSFLGGSIIAIILFLVILTLKDIIKKLTNFAKIQQNFSTTGILIASFTGIHLHILFDAPLYRDIKPLYPLDVNPFYGIVGSGVIYNVCAGLFLIGTLIYLFMFFKKK